MLREIVVIDEEKCNGCGNCVPGCPEGALQVIDGKARLVSDLLCDGLGACIGECPLGAIKVEKKESEPYDERRVMQNVIKQGENTIKAHLSHLKSHGQEEYYQEAIDFLNEKGVKINMDTQKNHAHTGGCPGSRVISFEEPNTKEPSGPGRQASQLRQWPVQLHLVSPQAPYFKGSDLLVAADCTAYAAGNFHADYLKGKSLVIACPKLDEGQESYSEKIRALIEEAGINTLTVLMMEVPCCGGLLSMVKQSASTAKRRVPIKSIIISLKGEKIREEWV